MYFEDPMVFEITEGGAEALSFMQGVLVDAQIKGTVQTNAFSGFTDGKLLIDTPHGGLSDSLPSA